MPALLVFGWLRRKEQPHPSTTSDHLGVPRQELAARPAPSSHGQPAPEAPLTICTIRVVPQASSETGKMPLRAYATLRLVGHHSRKRRKNPA
jgi:hypothetical protein